MVKCVIMLHPEMALQCKMQVRGGFRRLAEREEAAGDARAGNKKGASTRRYGVCSARGGCRPWSPSGRYAASGEAWSAVAQC